MGSSCSCQNFVEMKKELDILKERKRNRDFFIDYSIDNLKEKENIEDNNIIHISKQNSVNSLNSNNNELMFSTKSYSNILNNLPPIYRINSYDFGTNRLIVENKINENKNFNTKMILKKDEENNENQIIIEKTEENNKKVIIEKNEKIENSKKYNTKIQLKPKNIILNKNNQRDSCGNNSEDFLDNYSSNNIKNKIIYSCSTNIISKKKFEDDIISEEEYNLVPEDNYSRIIFDYINNLRTKPKIIAKMIEDNKKFITVGENNEIYFTKNNKKLILFKGFQIFDETVNILNSIEPMNKLIYNKNIAIKKPENEEDINNLEYLKFQVEELKNNGNHISSYWKEKIKDPEITFLMMVIDDNHIESGLKRRDLINPEIKYIGISSIEKDNNFACYLTLSYRK